jgi:hypothetical protein
MTIPIRPPWTAAELRSLRHGFGIIKGPPARGSLRERKTGERGRTRPSEPPWTPAEIRELSRVFRLG